jgi:hypothetical protein
MSNTTLNPLLGHFRQPALHLQLPSRGEFYPAGSIDLPETGEIPVYPMTVKDELTLKTPDALLNGSGVVSVIQSCCPAILNAWHVPSLDLDRILIAIRLASYGEGMDVVSTCPNCAEKNEHTVDLRVVLDNAPQVDFHKSSEVEGLVFKFKPQNYQGITQTGQVSFEEQRLVDSISRNADLPEAEKLRMFNQSFEKLKQMNVDVIVNSIHSITTPDGTVVSDPLFITEFVNNSSRQVYFTIKQQIQDLMQQLKLSDLKLTCDACSTQYASKLDFDNTSFFV